MEQAQTQNISIKNMTQLLHRAFSKGIASTLRL